MRVGMISTRFAGLDGVSLEAAKLAPAIREAGHEIVWFAGELGEGFHPGREVPEARFDSEENLDLQERAFGSSTTDLGLEQEIRKRASALRREVASFIIEFGVDVAYVHNALSIPMQLPLAVAVTEALIETGVRAVGHHHDFGWEKPRFRRCAVPGIVDMFFPPASETVDHVVINSLAAMALIDRTGLSSTLLPNILDFERGPGHSPHGAAYRRRAGVSDDALLLLQPTRVIERKGIESTILLAAALDRAAVVAFSHAEDRDDQYWATLTALATRCGVELVSCSVVSMSGGGDHGLAGAFAAADLVCFPSRQEGFGNALVEAIFYKRPLFVNAYDVFVSDIAPMGIDAVVMNGEVTGEVVDEVRALLESPRRSQQMVEHNYRVGIRHLSHAVVRERLIPLLER